MAGINDVTNRLRITGIASGLDTENMIKQLMRAERIPLDRLNQNKTLLEWKRDNYREITNLLRGFKDEFFDVLKPLTNMTSRDTYKKYSVTSTDTSVVTATANGDAIPKTHNIVVKELATAAEVVSSLPVTKDLVGANVAALDYTAPGTNQFSVTLNGVTKTITLRNSGVYASTAELISNGSQDGVQNLINQAFGAGKITVVDDGTGKLKFTTTEGRVTLTSIAGNTGLSNLGVTSGSTNRLNSSDQLQSLGLNSGLSFNGDGNLDFTINGVNFVINRTKTLGHLMNEVNSSGAGVILSYNESMDKFVLTAKQKGAGNAATIVNNAGTLFGAGSVINITNGTLTGGTDARFDLNGVMDIRRNDNAFIIEGVTYNLLKADPGGTAKSTITISQDSNAIYDNIKKFVDKYNETIAKIDTELSEERFRDYLPLTKEQKEELSEDEIKKWEEKAKSGLLRNDSILQQILVDVRRAFSDSVSGVSGSLYEIGIRTGAYTDKGKLIIDETKLKNAIQTNPDKVSNLFSKTSAIDYSPNLTASERTQRYSESGFAQRLSDILQDNIRTTRSTVGNKGKLIEKAGIIGDGTQYVNFMNREISQKEKQIYNLEEKLLKKEDNYYKRFAALERALNAMNSQSSWLYQQLNGGQQ